MKILFTVLVAALWGATAFAAGNVEKGKMLFKQNCTACHQENGYGKVGLGPRLNAPEFLAIANDKFLKTTILEGRAGTSMISFKIMPHVKSGVNDIIAYMRSWEKNYVNFKRANVNWSKKIHGDKKKGSQLFTTYCASCHGPRGHGYSNGGSGPGIGLAGFLSAASDDYIYKTIKMGRAKTAMRSFGSRLGLANIPDSDIRNIVAYLRSLGN